MAEKLFAEFPPISAEQWEEAIIKDLKGADYDKKLVWKTLDGFDLRPYYRAENLDGLKYLNSLPGEFPFVRGVCKRNNWKINQTIEPDPDGVKADNARILSVLAKGVDSINYRVKGPEGLSDAEFDELTAGIEMSDTEIDFKVCCNNATKTLRQIISKAKNENRDAKKIKGSINYDPLRRLILKGRFGNENPFDICKNLIEDAAELPSYRVIGVSPCIFHNAGSTCVQELAFGLATGSEYLARLTDAGLSADDVAGRMKFTFAVSSNYFMEIAKFRAARMLWANIVKAYGAEETRSMKMRIHAVTSHRNQSVYDPYVNMLRGTTEAMSAALAGVDSLEVTPFDAAFAKPDDFSLRIARNTQLLLKEESYFDRVADSGAGSYYIENITASIADAAWKLFKEIEDKGGCIEALKECFIQKTIKNTADKRNLNIAACREILLGVNRYPDFNETLSKEVRESSEQKEKCRCCGCSDESAREIVPIVEYRDARVFEKLRMKSESNRPVVFMLTYGNLAMCRARAQFACNFFACAGFKVIDNNRFATVEEGIEAAKKANARIVVACSSDDEYAESVPRINAGTGENVITVVAGEPACKADLEAQGITHFISIKSNMSETLKQYLKETGID